MTRADLLALAAHISVRPDADRAFAEAVCFGSEQQAAAALAGLHQQMMAQILGAVITQAEALLKTHNEMEARAAQMRAEMEVLSGR